MGREPCRHFDPLESVMSARGCSLGILIEQMSIDKLGRVRGMRALLPCLNGNQTNLSCDRLSQFTPEEMAQRREELRLKMQFMASVFPKFSGVEPGGIEKS